MKGKEKKCIAVEDPQKRKKITDEEAVEFIKFKEK